MKRKREAVNETIKSPEKKACKTLLGYVASRSSVHSSISVHTRNPFILELFRSVIATRTAVLPTAADAERRPLTRRRSHLSSKSDPILSRVEPW